MFTISKDNIITMTRGDSWSAPLFINKGTSLKPLRRVLNNGENVYLGIMEPNQPFEDAIIKKVYGPDNFNINSDVVVSIDPEDTECLIPGKYYYQIKARLFADKVLSEDIVITSNTILKAGCKIINNSIIDGHSINEEFTAIGTETILQPGDIIKRFSRIVSTSIINGEEIPVKYDVNTIVQKTGFNIVE